MTNTTNTLKIEKGNNINLGTRTIDPSNAFWVNRETATIHINEFERYKSNAHDNSAYTEIIEKSDTAVLLRFENKDWSKYSRAPFVTKGCYLIQLETSKRGKAQIGVDRVPCSCESIQSAIDFLTPAEVRKAREAGREVLRQGDVFFLEMKKENNFAALPDNHKLIETQKGYSVQHPEHHALTLPAAKKWKAIIRKTMNHIKAD